MSQTKKNFPEPLYDILCGKIREDLRICSFEHVRNYRCSNLLVFFETIDVQIFSGETLKYIAKTRVHTGHTPEKI